MMKRIGILLLIWCISATAPMPTPLSDSIIFGDPASEQAHSANSQLSEQISAALGQPARDLLAHSPAEEYGGSISFVAKCDPQNPNYATFKFWGGDAGEDRGRLLLFVEGKQLGVRHLGDVDILDILGDEPRYPGRFVYKTLPLPREMTEGKASIHLEVRALGPIWGYGTTYAQFQKPMTKISRGIYRAYIHSDPFFVPPEDDKEGDSILDPPVRTEPGPEVLDALEKRVNGEIRNELSSSRPLSQPQMEFLARAYFVKWTIAHDNSQAVRRLVDGLDAIYLDYMKNPHLAESDPATYNPDWFGLGPSGDVIQRMAAQLQPVLDQPIARGDGVTRREGWRRMLIACRDWHRRHRRLYTNQSMIVDTFGIYFPNRAIEVLNPPDAMPEAAIRHYFYQSMGLEPWLGSDTDSGPEKPVGDSYMELTDKGLTRELGYVGAYGEVLDWATGIYDATRPKLGAEGDARIKAQLIKIAKARAVFRHPFVDADGFRAMALETVVGWRDVHYPGDITYGQRTTWDAGPLETAAATLDPALVAYAQQMLEDNQFFAAVRERMKTGGIRVTAGLLDTPDEYELIKSQARQSVRLPMAPGQPDFVFSDEEDGVVAIKHGDEILYASLYWRARFGINDLARIHYLTPTMERDATEWETVQFDDSGLNYEHNGRVVEDQVDRYDRDVPEVKQALQGEIMPIGTIPPGIPFKPGDESVFAGKGSFYLCHYGHYLIGLNMSADRTFSMPRPAGIASATELVQNEKLEQGAPVTVPPRSTRVLYFGS